MTEYGLKIQACKNVLSGNLLLAIACMVVSCFGFGCEVDSFLDPSKTGYFEHTPTSMPILSRIDIIERETGYKPETTYPTPEDLVPNELQYRLEPGDVVTVEIYELVKANETDRSVRVIDQSGVIRLPTLGDVQAAGLTVQELQEEIISRLKDLIGDPLVTVVLEDGRSFQFTIYGAVSGTGIYSLTRPDFRVMDAMSIAGGTASTTQRLLVIREAALDDSVNPSYLRDSESDSTTKKSDASGTVNVSDIDDLINKLDQEPTPSPGARSAQDDPPVDVDSAQSVPEKARTTSNSKFVFDEESQQWIRSSGGSDSKNGKTTESASVNDGTTKDASPFVTRIIEIDYQALARGDSNLNIVIRPGDRIFVDTPDVGVVYVDGDVTRPGVYQLPVAGKLTLSRLIAAAGGLNPLAIPERVDLIRKIAPDRESALRINLAAIRNRAEPDIYMRQDDHVIIGTNFWAAPLAVVRNGFRMTYGFGFLLDRNFGNDVFGPPPVNVVGR